METGKPELASVPAHITAVTQQAEKKMTTQAPLTAVYIQTVPAFPTQFYRQLPSAVQEPATLHLAMLPVHSKEAVPFLNLDILGGMQSHSGLNLPAAALATKPKSAGKHVCPHCGRDCMKPSVLEKHIRCHTGERPYPCITCGVSFKTQSNLYKHRRTQAHARLSSESEQSSLSSLDSSRETCTSSLSLEEHDESGNIMENNATPPAAEKSTSANTVKANSVQVQGPPGAQEEPSFRVLDTGTNERERGLKEEEKWSAENAKPHLTVSQHLPLQRQEAMLFPKKWNSSVSKGKSQSRESTDSGFSESSDYPSPSSVLTNYSMDFLTESNKNSLVETTSASIPADRSEIGQDLKDTAREQGQKTLEERIAKLISENTAVVEDKQLEHVRPRKTVLSKQGSIDLPMPYTYKDSFHFDMKNSSAQNTALQNHNKPGLPISVPTQYSSTVKHAPLTRSNSLPFSVIIPQPEKRNLTSSYQGDYVILDQRRSSGQISSTGSVMKPVNQQSSTHRPLVRQTAVDCNHATDGLFTNSSVEEACTGNLSCSGDGRNVCGEPNTRKFRRKKVQKFAYNKWYMYGGGTFKKLYNTEKSGDNSNFKGRKCSTNSEHEVVSCQQKQVSVVSEEMATTTGLATNLTISTATVDPYSASLSLVSTGNHILQRDPLNLLSSSSKAQPRRNASLSVLSLPATGSLVSHETECLNITAGDVLINEEKHSDSTSQQCGTHIPSDTEDQKCDEKMTSPLEMETKQNTMSHSPPSNTGSVPPHGKTLPFVNLQKKQRNTELAGNLFLPCKLNASAHCARTSPATSIQSTARSSFLPKYQLKLPNAPEPESSASLPSVSKPKCADGYTRTPVLSTSSDQIVTASENPCGNPITSALMQACDVKLNGFTSTQNQLFQPCTVTTLCGAKTPWLSQNLESAPAIVHRQFAATTITTSCFKDDQTALCSTLNSAAGSVTLQLPRAPKSAAVDVSFNTANSQTSSAALTALSQSDSPLSHKQLSAASCSSNHGNQGHVDINTVVHCPIVPFDHVQSPQNVFHVHTSDLQICLQIISDEQLALIEPQIERLSGSSQTQRYDVETNIPKVAQNKAQSTVAMENEERNHVWSGDQKEKQESFSTFNREGVTVSLSSKFGKADQCLHVAEHSNTTQTATSTESVSTPGQSLHAHKYGHRNTVTQTLSSVVSTVASLRGVKSGESQTSEAEQAFQKPYRNVSQCAMDSQKLSSPPNLSMSLVSASTENQNDMKREFGKKRQHQLKNNGTSHTADPLKPFCEDSEHKSCWLESGRYVCKTNSSALSFSINKCKDPRQLSPHTSNNTGLQAEPISCTSPNLSKHANRKCSSVGQSDNSSASMEITPGESQDLISINCSEKALGQFTSLSSQMEVDRNKDTAVVCGSIQSLTTGLLEGASPMEYTAQKELQPQKHAQPERTAWTPKQNQREGGTNHQGFQEHSSGGVTGEDKNREIKTGKIPESSCRHVAEPDLTKPEEEDVRFQGDPLKSSWVPEHHLQHISQLYSGVSEFPSQSPLEAASIPNSLSLTASCIHDSLLNFPLSENHNFYHLQQKSSILNTQQTELLCESSSSPQTIAQVQLSEAKNVFSRTELELQTQSFLYQDLKQNSTLSAQQGNTTAGICNTASHRDATAPGSQKVQSLLTDFDLGASSSTHSSQVSQVCRNTAGSTEDIQISKNKQNTGSPLKSFTYVEPDMKQDTADETQKDYASHRISSGGADTVNKYKCLFRTGSLHDQQPAECLSGGVRLVQSCHDYTEDTSSSDDEGKLIIEL